MKVLITGGTGVNGAATARLLVSGGLRPVLFDSRTDFSLIEDLRNDVDLVTGDIRDAATLKDVVTFYQISHIAHLAALMPGPAEANPSLGISVGVDGTLNVLEVARFCNIRRVVYTSSNAVSGEISGKHGHPEFVPLDESHPRNPADIYGVTKVCSETLGNYYRKRYGIEFIALRYPSIYGPGKLTRHGVLALYGKIIEDVVAGREVVIPRGGDQRNDVVYVGDVARSIAMALKAEGLEQWTFNVGTGEGVTLKDFARVLATLFPSAKMEIGPGLDFRDGVKQSYCIFDISKARKHLGYTPRYDLESGIKDYIDLLGQMDRQ